MSKQGDKLFHLADFAIIRAAKNCEVVLTDVPDENIIHLKVDEEDMIVKKAEGGYLRVLCACPFCSTVGVAKNLLCRRKIAAYWYLVRMGGRVSEIYVSKEKDR